MKFMVAQTQHVSQGEFIRFSRLAIVFTWFHHSKRGWSFIRWLIWKLLRNALICFSRQDFGENIGNTQQVVSLA